MIIIIWATHFSYQRIACFRTRGISWYNDAHHSGLVGICAARAALPKACWSERTYRNLQLLTFLNGFSTTYNAPLLASWSNRASNILPRRILETNAIVRHPRLRRPSTCISPWIYTRMANGTANFHPHQSPAPSIPHYDYMRRTYIFSPCLNAGLLHGG